jgi:hypothetical protein
VGRVSLAWRFEDVWQVRIENNELVFRILLASFSLNYSAERKTGPSCETFRILSLALLGKLKIPFMPLPGILFRILHEFKMCHISLFLSNLCLTFGA